MAGDNISPHAKVIPNSLIKGQLVENAGKLFLIERGKLPRTDDHEISLAFEIAPYGKELKNPTAFWTGPISGVKVTESDVLKGGSETVTFTWNIDPMTVLFAPNRFVLTWGDGIDCLKQGHIQVSPAIEDMPAYLQNPKNSWCYRFVLLAESYDEFRIVLETVPATLAALQKCPWGETLLTGGCEIDRWSVVASQALPQGYGPGILPFFHDMRLPKYEKESTLPESSEIRLKVYEALSLMGTTHDLEEDEMDGYNPSHKKRSPSFPEIALVEEGGVGSRKRKASDEPVIQPSKAVVGLFKKKREYVPRECWIMSKAVTKKIPKRKVMPINRPETLKYSTNPKKGMFTKESLVFPQEWSASPGLKVLIQNTIDNLQASVSVDTWSNYSTAVNNLRRCSEYLDISMDLPLDEIRIILYVAYLIKIRGVLPSTVGSYLSGLRMAHWARGFSVQTLRNQMVNQVLQGATNLKNIRQEGSKKPQRRAMTIPLLAVLHQRIQQSGWTAYKMILVWCVSAVAFFGAFRLGELLSKAAGFFDAQHTLLARDISFHSLSATTDDPKTLARIHVKSPKVDRIGKGDEVEIFSINKKAFCPITALEKYISNSKKEDNFDPGMPLFRKESGANYSKQDFNKDLREMFQKDMDYKKEGVWAHSFRAGVSSHMDRWGFNAEEIKGWGRWSSDAYKRYCRLPTLARRRLANQIQEKFESTLVAVHGVIHSAEI